LHETLILHKLLLFGIIPNTEKEGQVRINHCWTVL